MAIDLQNFQFNTESSISIDEMIQFPKSYFENQEILDLKDVRFQGKITLDEDNNIEVVGNLTGIMALEDSISLEKIDYPFTISVEEIQKNEEIFENTIDILEILWQNLVLEVPLRFTKVEDYSKFKGDGWKLLSEDEVKTSNNPFEDLKNMFGKE